MSHAHRGIGFLAVSCLVVVTGCFGMGLGLPVTPPGVISPDRRAPRRVGVQVQLRWQTLVEGGLALHVEPPVTKETSLPMTVSGGFWSGFQSRFGVRHRVLGALTLGGGVGMNAWYHEPDAPPWSHKPYIAGVFDLEVGIAGRLDWFGTTLVIRPCLGVYEQGLSQGTGLFGFFELRHAWLFYVSRRTAFTVRFELGLGNDPVVDAFDASHDRFAGDRLFFYGVSLGIMLVL